MFKQTLGVAATVLLVSTSSVSLAQALPGYVGKVTRIVNQEGLWGGCAARMDPSPTTISGLEGCQANYVTFDCDGSSGQTTKTAATAKLSNAQLSFVADYPFYVKVDPSVRLNGVCYAIRADVLAPPD